MNDNQTKYLILRANTWHYIRKIPLDLRDLLGRVYHKESLGTSDLQEAMRARDLIAKADNAYWDEVRMGGGVAGSIEQYEKVIARARTMRLQYLTADKIAEQSSLSELMVRIKLLEAGGAAKAEITQAAAIGSIDKPKDKMSDVLTLYKDKIMAHDLTKKNERQYMTMKVLRV
uniref:DUF6538 domain-containing protein n=1 Tax=OCS116 cluster bacterium TaxID=2030921 RepID=A0A2A4Z7Y3_9PROT